MKEKIKTLVENNSNIEEFLSLSESERQESVFNGDKFYNPYTLMTSNYKEFVKHIKSLPNTLDVRIDNNADPYRMEANAAHAKGSNWKKIVLRILDEVASNKEFKIDKFLMRSYHGWYGKEEQLSTLPYYITFDSKKKRNFQNNLGSGKYGSLD